MATSVTIDPSLGEAVLFTEDGVGDSTGYHWIDVRRAAQGGDARQEGVFDPTGWKVTQNSGGANMSVDVAANVGLAAVQGDSAVHQSRFIIAPHSAVADLDIGANATGTPRIDQIILQVRDTTHDGSTFNDARVLVLAGVATSGATLENRTGAVNPLPASAIRLADILVADGAASITTSVIRDRRPWARGAQYAKPLVSGNVTTTSTTFTGVTSEFTTRVEFGGLPVRVRLVGRLQHATDQQWVAFVLDDNGTKIGPILLHTVSGAAGNVSGVLFEHTYTPTPGTHLLDMNWRSSDGGLATLYGGATNISTLAGPAVLTIEELPAASASNS